MFRSMLCALLAALMLTAVCHAAELEEDEMKITITIGEASFPATLVDVPAARELLERLPLTLDMRELNGNEKYCYFDSGFTTQSERVGSIQTGDLMLYGAECLVLFYESFRTPYSYTRLGAVDDPVGLAEALGRGNVEVTFDK